MATNEITTAEYDQTIDDFLAGKNGSHGDDLRDAVQDLPCDCEVHKDPAGRVLLSECERCEALEENPSIGYVFGR